MTASRPAPRRGSSWTPLESPPDLFAWPFDPSLVWFRLVDLLALATVVLWLGRRLRDRFLVIDVNLRLGDTVLAVAGLLRRADTSDPAVIPRGRRYGRWIAAVWAVAILGSLGAIKLVPVGEVSGASCAISGGSRQPRSGRHEGTRTACAVTQNRAWLTDATVQGIDAGQLAAAPWRVTLVRDAGMGFRPIAPVRLTPRSTRDMFVLVRFTACRPAMSGRTFTLSTVPLRVHAYGRTQTDPVPLSQPVRRSCP